MKISANFDEVDKSLEKAIAEIERKLTNMVRSYAQEIVYKAAVDRNPLGNHIRDAYWYGLRQVSTGLQPIHGFSKGSWQANPTNVFTRIERYGETTAEAAVAGVPSDMASYVLGQKFYIGNEGPYIQIINQRYAIVQNTMKDIMNAYQVDLKTAFNKG